MRVLLASVTFAAVAACNGGDTAASARPEATQGAAPGAATTAPAVSYGQANTQYQSAFPGQSRAPAAQRTHAWQVQPAVSSGLGRAWSFEPLGDGRWLVAEKAGRMRIVAADGRVLPPITAGVPPVDAERQGGLLDVALAPDFARTNRIYWSYSEPRQGGNGTAVATGTLSGGDNPALSDVRVIWRMQPTLDSKLHFGSRLVFDRQGRLFVTLGDRSILPGRAQSQDLNSHFGKIVRINADGSVPADNPYVNRQGARPDIYAIGVRNVQAAALHPETGELWEIEHGPRGGDEVNRILPGRDYGWPTISYGVEYQGPPIGQGRTAAPGMEQPIYYWDPVIAPSGMLFYTGNQFPAWRNNIFVGAHGGLQSVVRLVLDGDRVVGEERLPLGARIRDVKQGPDGALYALTDEESSRILRITPRS